jgi:hypothetical protein
MRNSLPSTSAPGTVDQLYDTSGALIQSRYYGADGRAVKNVDYDHDHGAGAPHAHDWDWSKTPPRQPARALVPGELR